MLAISGNDFSFFFQYNQAKNRARRSKIDSKIETFCLIDIRDLDIFEVKKVVFWTFSEFFLSCLESVLALLLTLKGLVLVVLSAPKVDK